MNLNNWCPYIPNDGEGVGAMKSSWSKWLPIYKMSWSIPINDTWLELFAYDPYDFFLNNEALYFSNEVVGVVIATHSYAADRMTDVLIEFASKEERDSITKGLFVTHLNNDYLNITNGETIGLLNKYIEAYEHPTDKH